MPLKPLSKRVQLHLSARSGRVTAPSCSRPRVLFFFFLYSVQDGVKKLLGETSFVPPRDHPQTGGDNTIEA